MPVKNSGLNKAKDRTLRLLDSIATGMLYFEVKGRYRTAFINDGLAGMKRLAEYEANKRYRERYADLRRRALIEERRIGKRITATLTDRGEVAFLRLQARAARRLESGGRIHVMYDIPERHRTARDALRTWLKQAGFRLHQRSIWITDRNVAAPMKAWIVKHRLKKWIDVIES